ncbi:MAG TPA: protein-disulfide reductase DsbD domain-containing protein [Flavitalea sp.]|nr:protein-disulfide reductase DsbD domain-containing protein [Flavitalea sp.]
MKKFSLLIVSLITASVLFAQSNKQVKWAFSSKKIADKTYEVHMTATINGNFHMYAQNVGVEGPLPTAFVFTKNPLLQLDGKVKEVGKLVKKHESTWGGNVNYYEKTVNFVQTVKVRSSAKTNLAGKVEFMVCDDSRCLPPGEVEFSVNIGG